MWSKKSGILTTSSIVLDGRKRIEGTGDQNVHGGRLKESTRVVLDYQIVYMDFGV